MAQFIENQKCICLSPYVFFIFTEIRSHAGQRKERDFGSLCPSSDEMPADIISNETRSAMLVEMVGRTQSKRPHLETTTLRKKYLNSKTELELLFTINNNRRLHGFPPFWHTYLSNTGDSESPPASDKQSFLLKTKVVKKMFSFFFFLFFSLYFNHDKNNQK